MSDRSPLTLHMPDADDLKDYEYQAVLDLKPASMLVVAYPAWDADKGAAERVRSLVRNLGHTDLYVRFHADPNPVKFCGPAKWGRLCAQRMEQYYGELAAEGVRLHAILYNEVDADYEGGLSPRGASSTFATALSTYADLRPDDIVHVPAPTGAPSTHREHLTQFRSDGWVRPGWWIDGHGYDGDLENVINVLEDVFPDHERMITETNDLDDFSWPSALIEQGRVRAVSYFTLNWARGGEGRVRAPDSDDAAKRMSLLRWPDRYQQFKATIAAAHQPTPEPVPAPAPEPEQEPVPMSREEVIALICEKADQYNLSRVELLGGAIAESNLDPRAWRQGEWPDWSAGLYQQTVLYADEGDHTAAGANVELIKRLYFDPAHAADVAAVKYRYWRFDPEVPAEQAWCAYNWPGSYGHYGDNPNLANYQRGLREAAQLLGAEEPAAPPATTDEGRYYGGDVPDTETLQHNDWSCAVRSTYAALWAMAQQGQGEPVSYGDGGPRDVYEWMVPGIDDSSTGLHYGDGHELVTMLRERGYQARRTVNAPLEAVQEQAGLHPVLLGGHGWGPAGHWVYCRGVEADGTLVLENPAGTYLGVGGEMLDSFARFAPWTMVTIDLPPAVPALPWEDDMSAAERAELLDLREKLPGLVSAVAYLADDVVGARVAKLPESAKKWKKERDAIVAEAQRVRLEYVGKRPAA